MAAISRPTIGIRRELVPSIHHRAAGGAVACRIIGEGLRRREQGVRGRSQPIQLIVSKRLRASSIGETRPIPHRVVGIGGLVNLCRTRHDLVQNVGHLTRGIIG